jgi:hypothetical protein
MRLDCLQSKMSEDLPEYWFRGRGASAVSVLISVLMSISQIKKYSLHVVYGPLDC